MSELSPIATDAPAALEGIELARRVADELSEKQAEGIVLLDISEVSSVADYFVIATTRSKRQFNAITDALRKVSEPRPRIEGTPQSGWLLYDFGDVVVHVFGQAERDYYDLESLWSHGRQLLRLE